MNPSNRWRKRLSERSTWSDVSAITRLIPTKGPVDGLGMMLARLVSLGCGVAVTAIASRLFSHPEFGVWALLTPLLTLILNVDLGVASAMRNRLVIEGARAAQRDFSTGFFGLMALALVYGLAALVGYLFGGFGFLFKTDDAELRDIGSLLLLISALISVFRMPLYLAMNGFFSYRENLHNAAFDTTMSLSFLVVIVVAAALHSPMFPAVLAYQAVGIGVSLAAFVYFMRRRRWVLEWPQDFLSRAGALLKKSLPFCRLQLLSMILSYSSIFTVSATIGVQEAGPFRAATSIFISVAALQYAYCAPLWSEFSYAIVANSRADLVRLLRKGLKQTTLAAVPLTVLTMIGPGLMRLWLGIQFDNWVMMLLLAVWTMLLMFNNVLSFLFNGVGKPDLTTLCILPSAVLMVPLTIWFGHLFGVAGVAGAMALTTIVSTALMAQLVYRFIKSYPH